MRARDKGRLLRGKYQLTGAVDVEALADSMGLRVHTWDLPAAEVHETMLGRNIAVSDELNDQERRWAIAHGIGHKVLHPGNQLWLRAHTMLAIPYERQAEQFTYGLLVDEREVLLERLRAASEVAGHFGVPLYTLLEHCPDVWGQIRLF